MRTIILFALSLFTSCLQAATASQLERALREQLEEVSGIEAWVAEETVDLERARERLQQAHNAMNALEPSRLAADQALRESEAEAGSEQHEQLKSAWMQADDAYWDARRVWEHAVSGFNVADGVLVRAEASLDQALDKLADLRLDAFHVSAESEPAYLKRVIATQDGRAVYEAAWEDREVVIDQQIRLLRVAIADQRLQVRLRSEDFDAAYRALERYGSEMDALSAEYEQAIWAQAYRTILIQTGGAAVNVALGSAQRSPLASAAIELFSRGADILTTDYQARYDLPVLGSDTPNPGKSLTAAVETAVPAAVVNGYKNLVLAAVEGYAGGRLTIEAVEDWKLQVWLLPKLESAEPIPLAAAGETARAHLLAIRQGRISEAFRDAVRRSLRNIDGAALTRDIGAAFVVDVAEGAAVELARQDRIETFRRWIAFDAEIAAARQALYLARVGWQTERLQLNALHLALQDRINVREQEDNSRTLLVQVDREIRRTEPLNLTLEFSRDVDQVRVLLAGQMLEPAGGYFDLATTLTPEALESLPDLGRLRITAQDLLSATSIDRNPATRPYLGPEADWLGVEPGADTHHILKLDDGLLVAGDLEGIWAGTGYTCGGAVPDQILEVTADGENLTATKLVGDTCITAGEVSWMGRFDQNRFPVRFHVSDLDGSNKRWLNREIKPINRDTLQGMGITFRRLRN